MFGLPPNFHVMAQFVAWLPLRLDVDHLGVVQPPYDPISDDEFVRRCSPGVKREVALTVRRILSEQLGIDYERIHPDHRLANDLGCY